MGNLYSFGIEVVAVIKTLRCPAMCRHCAYNCGPNVLNEMPDDFAMHIIDQASKIPTVKSIGITGGEPFYSINSLFKICEYSYNKYGLTTSVSTNSFWANSEANAKSILAQMHELGLRILLISIDDYHLEYISIDRIRNCIKAALSLGIFCTIQTITGSKSHNLIYFKELLNDIYDPNLINYAENPIDPFGRAAFLNKTDFRYLPKFEKRYCSMMRILLVNIQGDVVPCCGMPIFIKPFKIGNIKNESLSDMIKRANIDPILNAIAIYGGPTYFVKLLKSREGIKLSPSDYTSHCHACYEILTNEELYKCIRRFVEEEWQDLLGLRILKYYQWNEYLEKKRKKRKSLVEKQIESKTTLTY
jgi:MoaA/NifB/PqqE/SkfB family radical SAM enzyme